MAIVRNNARTGPVGALIAGLMCVAAACGVEPPTSAEAAHPEGTTVRTQPGWEEPASYTYTFKSSQGERMLVGTFRVKVRDHKVVEAVGLDKSGRRVVRQSPESVPTIGELMKQWEQARHDNADTADVTYAADGHPVRIALDWDSNAIDDEARYVISSYRPAGR